MSKDDDQAQDGSAPDPAVTYPNPLGSGALKLTLPGEAPPADQGLSTGEQSPQAPQRREAVALPPRRDSEAEATDDAGQGSTAEPSSAVWRHTAPAGGDDAERAESRTLPPADTVDDDADQGVAASEAAPGGGIDLDGETVDYAGFGDAEADRSPDRSIVRVLAAVVAVVVVVGGVVWWFARPQTPPAPAQLHPAVPAAGPSGPAPAAAPVSSPDVPLPITVSGQCPQQTDPRLATSTDPNTAWVCPTGGLPFGQQLTLTLPKLYVITGVKFWPGFQGKGADGADEWYRHRLVQHAQLVFDDADRTLVPLDPLGQRHEYAKPINHLVASGATLLILDSSAPPPAPPASMTAQPPAPGDPSSTSTPDMGPLFPAPSGEGTGTDDPSAPGPNADSVALWGLQLIGHPVAP